MPTYLKQPAMTQNDTQGQCIPFTMGRAGLKWSGEDHYAAPMAIANRSALDPLTTRRHQSVRVVLAKDRIGHLFGGRGHDRL